MSKIEVIPYNKYKTTDGVEHSSLESATIHQFKEDFEEAIGINLYAPVAAVILEKRHEVIKFLEEYNTKFDIK